jgi:pantothenate kinase-related protein Tda10
LIGAWHFTADKTSNLTTPAITTAFDKGEMSWIVRVLFPFSDIEPRIKNLTATDHHTIRRSYSQTQEQEHNELARERAGNKPKFEKKDK